jgi:hypothetical protein
MEPRQLWDRHTVLAEAFCQSDEHVRAAQGALDAAQAERSRLLAAFAVTVGSDGAVADLMGLSERTVRVARRSVGKDAARGVAEALLTPAPPPPAAEPDPALTVPSSLVPSPPPTVPEPEMTPHPDPLGQQMPSVMGAPQQYTAPEPPPEPVPYMPLTREPTWSGAMDALLVGSYQTGVDLHVLAAEFGLDLGKLISRAQQLSAEGRLLSPYLTASMAEERTGRHRGTSETGGYSYGYQGQPTGWDMAHTWPDEMLDHMPYQQQWPQYSTSAM